MIILMTKLCQFDPRYGERVICIVTMLVLFLLLFSSDAGAQEVKNDRSELERRSEVRSTPPILIMPGPVHEAMAILDAGRPSPQAVVMAVPPAPINENIPRLKPSGKNVQWIPGYWTWDAGRKDFIWRTGVWRDVPPGRRWVPGYWDAANSVLAGSNTSRWIPGFWNQADSVKLTYLPVPPSSLGQDPETAAVSDDQAFLPGHWSYRDEKYVWQKGGWQPRPQGKTWTPASYVWTPRGCLFRSGFWDYSVSQRGVSFLAVQFLKPVYQEKNYRLSPSPLPERSRVETVEIGEDAFVRHEASRLSQCRLRDLRKKSEYLNKIKSSVGIALFANKPDIQSSKLETRQAQIVQQILAQERARLVTGDVARSSRRVNTAQQEVDDLDQQQRQFSKEELRRLERDEARFVSDRERLQAREKLERQSRRTQNAELNRQQGKNKRDRNGRDRQSISDQERLKARVNRENELRRRNAAELSRQRDALRQAQRAAQDSQKAARQVIERAARESQRLQSRQRLEDRSRRIQNQRMEQKRQQSLRDAQNRRNGSQ